MTKGQKMKSIEGEIARIDAEIARLQARREAFVDALAIVSGTASLPLTAPSSRRRSAGVKPLVLDIMANVGENGAASADVTDRVKEKMPAVTKDTVGSVLSRLKADGALVHDGERYYDKRFAPKPPQSPFEGKLRVAS
jgi:hypothetical protein